MNMMLFEAVAKFVIENLQNIIGKKSHGPF